MFSYPRVPSVWNRVFETDRQLYSARISDRQRKTRHKQTYKNVKVS